MTWEIILFLAAAMNGLVIGAMLITRESNVEKTSLGIYLVLFSMLIIHYVNYWTNAVSVPPVIQLTFGLVDWLMAPALYFFFRGRDGMPRLWMHLIIPTVFVLYWIMMRSLTAPEVSPIAAMILSIVKISYLTVYGILMLKVSNNSVSDRLFLLPYAAFVLGLILYHASIRMGFYTLRIDYLICAVFTLLTYAITYYSEFGFLNSNKPKYATSSLTKEEGDHLVSKINEVLREKKYYRDPDFNLSSFAEKLGVPKYRISHALNAFSDTSFSSLINELRVTDAVEKLQNEATGHLKLEAIGEEVGFRNKVSFYKHFKARVGKSPGEFREACSTDN